MSDGETTLLLECGLTFKELQKRLGYGVAGITACLVSAMSTKTTPKPPHSCCKAGVPVYMSEGTAAAHKDAMDAAHAHQGRRGAAVRTPDRRAVPHLSTTRRSRSGFSLRTAAPRNGCSGRWIPRNLGVTADRLTYIAVECNYEESLLNRSDRIPSVLKERIRHSHFEVSDVIRWLHKQDLSGVLTIWLLHLSAGNSRAEAWQREV